MITKMMGLPHIAIIGFFTSLILWTTPAWCSQTPKGQKPEEEMKCVSGFCLPRGYKKLETPMDGKLQTRAVGCLICKKNRTCVI